jgi:Ca2+-binding EF-hand superfamily protein
MNEVLTTVKKPTATKGQLDEFFKKYDKDGDGQLDKQEMTKFIKEYIKNPPVKDHLQDQHDAL